MLQEGERIIVVLIGTVSAGGQTITNPVVSVFHQNGQHSAVVSFVHGSDDDRAYASDIYGHINISEITPSETLMQAIAEAINTSLDFTRCEGGGGYTTDSPVVERYIEKAS